MILVAPGKFGYSSKTALWSLMELRPSDGLTGRN